MSWYYKFSHSKMHFIFENFIFINNFLLVESLKLILQSNVLRFIFIYMYIFAA